MFREYDRPPMSTVRRLGKSGRLYWALARLSRDRWLSYREVQEKGMRLARCLAPVRASQILDESLRREVVAVGMLDGEPPFYLGDSQYSQMLELAQRKPKLIEFEILKLMLKGR